MFRGMQELLFGIFVTAVFSVVSCGQGPQPSSSELSRIIGKNDLVRITKRFQNKDLVRAIGRMDLGCTATHVGGGIVITAGHCFASRPFEGRRESLGCSARSYNVTWGLVYESRGYLRSECTEVIATEYNNYRDYAIFRVSPQPDAALSVAKQKPGIGAKISILSHPRKRPLEWSGYCSLEGFFPHSMRQQFRYQCDTEGGSSGAAILNERMEVVGIHDYYNEEFRRNGGTSILSTPLGRILSRAGI